MAIACEDGCRKIVPLMLRLWSAVHPEYVSENDEVEQVIGQVASMTNGRSLTALFKDGDIPGQSCPRNVVNYIIIRAQIKEVGAYLCHTYPILLQRAIPQATAKMLIQQLREMKGDELVSRKVYPVVPPKTEYSLTDLGKSLVPIVKAMDKWGAAWFTRMGLPVPCDKET